VKIAEISAEIKCLEMRVSKEHTSDEERQWIKAESVKAGYEEELRQLGATA
jgi:hypothetical protein